MYRERGGIGSKGKMERSSTATSSRAGGTGLSLSNGKETIVNNNNSNKDRSSPGNPKISSSSRSSYPNKKHSKGEENVVEESETDSEESDVSGSDGEDTSWISWFCSLRGNEFFCEVDENYIQDDFNLCGLSSQVPYYDYALDLILDVESSHGDMFSEEQNEIIESAAEMLYGLIHVRYILTTKGLGTMLEKYKNAEFGRCPRVYCCGQPCLPVGQSDISRQNNVKIFCPKCEDIYTPQSRFQDNLDGAYFGSTFPHLFLMTYGHLKPQKTTQDYVPRVFGFKVHKP
ncbi:casein kinase II subunit beta-2-like [Rutidosis leptorrhynchoides]|uniref:casein kinase II subunit beta-2-like n=1 Tax=Rutidosis leptorrhynchoides TaxID=125765 RepID=UPI003A99426E